MPVGPNTLVVDGQRFAVPTQNAYNPVGYGQLVNLTPISQLNQPPMVGVGGGNSGGGALGADVVGGYGTAGNNALATIKANANPWSLRESPVIWAVLLLLIGLFGLTAIHWRKTTLAGIGESGHVEGANEKVEASV